MAGKDIISQNMGGLRPRLSLKAAGLSQAPSFSKFPASQRPGIKRVRDDSETEEQGSSQEEPLLHKRQEVGLHEQKEGLDREPTNLDQGGVEKQQAFEEEQHNEDLHPDGVENTPPSNVKANLQEDINALRKSLSPPGPRPPLSPVKTNLSGKSSRERARKGKEAAAAAALRKKKPVGTSAAQNGQAPNLGRAGIAAHGQVPAAAAGGPSDTTNRTAQQTSSGQEAHDDAGAGQPLNADERVALMQHRRAAEYYKKEKTRLEKALAENQAQYNRQQTLLLQAQDKLMPSEFLLPKVLLAVRKKVIAELLTGFQWQSRLYASDEIIFNTVVSELSIETEEDYSVFKRAWEQELSRKFNRNYNERRSDIYTSFRKKLFELLQCPRLAGAATPEQNKEREEKLQQISDSKVWLYGEGGVPEGDEYKSEAFFKAAVFALGGKNASVAETLFIRHDVLGALTYVAKLAFKGRTLSTTNVHLDRQEMDMRTREVRRLKRKGILPNDMFEPLRRRKVPPTNELDRLSSYCFQPDGEDRFAEPEYDEADAGGEEEENPEAFEPEE